MVLGDTIAAIATPPGIAGIGVIRISGPDALKYLQALTQTAAPPTPRMVYFKKIFTKENKQLDEACTIYFTSPHSYTGEDIVELHLHGNPLVLKMVLEELVQLGARLATPGEFTKRALINGKIDLTKAEAIDSIIHAESELAHTVALKHLSGKLLSQIEAIRSNLLLILEQMEGSIDFPDEVEPINRDTLQKTIQTEINKLHAFIKLKDYGEKISSGIKCIIIGKPNVGKSSLLNKVIGENKAIVSTIAGTTRDTIEAKLNLGGLIFEFVDTAGIRKSQDTIEKLGIKKIDQWIKKSDVLCWIIDRSQTLSNEDLSIFNKIKSKKNVVILLNKSDKTKRVRLTDEILTKKWPIIEINTKADEHLLPLKEWLFEHFSKKASAANLDLICNIRQINCLLQTEKSLKHLIDGIKMQFEDAMLVIDIKDAVLHLGEMTGHELTEEVLDGVFARFCVGK